MLLSRSRRALIRENNSTGSRLKFLPYNLFRASYHNLENRAPRSSFSLISGLQFANYVIVFGRHLMRNAYLIKKMRILLKVDELQITFDKNSLKHQGFCIWQWDREREGWIEFILNNSQAWRETLIVIRLRKVLASRFALISMRES